MKKLILLCASVMFVGAVAVNAQSSDTTNRPAKAQTMQPTPEQSNQMTDTKDQVKIKSAEVPASLRKTLEDPMYVGWKKSTIWRNKTTEEYTVDLVSGTTTKTYRFDKTGKPIKDF